MNDAVWIRTLDLLADALELPMAERHAFLCDACAGDPEMLEKIERLLASEAQASAMFEGASRLPTDAWQAPRATGRNTTPLDAESRNYDRNITSDNFSTPPDIPKYRILERIGEGGMGTVWRAEQERPRRIVALKLIKPGFASNEALRRFEEEANILGQMQHPGIVRIYEAGAPLTAQGQQPFFAMEFIHGQTLSEYARTKKLGLAERLELLARICDAVEYAHAKGVIHRDLKPTNILVDETGEPKILDFGIARVTGPHAGAPTMHTSPGQILGALCYMAPEQAGGKSCDTDARSDVYSLGVIAYELVSDRLPHDFEGSTMLQSIRIACDEPPRPLGQINPVISGDLQRVIHRCLEKDPARRYQRASDLARAVRTGIEEMEQNQMSLRTSQRQAFGARRKLKIYAFVGLSASLAAAGIVTEHGRYPHLPTTRPQAIASPPQPTQEQRLGPQVPIASKGTHDHWVVVKWPEYPSAEAYKLLRHGDDGSDYEIGWLGKVTTWQDAPGAGSVKNKFKPGVHYEYTIWAAFGGRDLAEGKDYSMGHQKLIGSAEGYALAAPATGK